MKQEYMPGMPGFVEGAYLTQDVRIRRSGNGYMVYVSKKDAEAIIKHNGSSIVRMAILPVVE